MLSVPLELSFASEWKTLTLALTEKFSRNKFTILSTSGRIFLINISVHLVNRINLSKFLNLIRVASQAERKNGRRGMAYICLASERPSMMPFGWRTWSDWFFFVARTFWLLFHCWNSWCNFFFVALFFLDSQFNEIN